MWPKFEESKSKYEFEEVKEEDVLVVWILTRHVGQSKASRNGGPSHMQYCYNNTSLFNSSLKSRQVLGEWKAANVTLVP